MGGSSSAPASPQMSPDIRVTGRVSNMHVRQISGSPPAGKPCEPNSRSQSSERRMPRGCRDDQSGDDDSECEDDEDESDCDDDEEDDEEEEEDDCDEDENEDEECEDEEEEEEENEEECDKPAFTPCRDPKVEKDNEKSDSEEEVSQQSSVYSPCRDSPRTIRSSAKGDNKSEDSRTPAKGDKKPDDSRTPAKGDKKPDDSRTPAKGDNKSDDTQHCQSPQENKQTASPPPCKEQSKNENRGLSPLSALTRVFFPCKETPHAETSPKEGEPSGAKANPPSTTAKAATPKSDKEHRACWAKQQENLRAKERETNQENSHGGSLRCTKSVSVDKLEKRPQKTNDSETRKPVCREDKSYKPKPDEDKINGESLKDLHKGCAYLSKREIRKVCNKYQSYGYVKENFDDPADEGPKPQKINTEVYSVGYLTSSDLPGISSGDYSGRFGPASNVNIERISLDHTSRRRTRHELQGAVHKTITTAQYTGDGSAADVSSKWYGGHGGMSLDTQERVRGRVVEKQISDTRKHSPASGRVSNSRWQSRSISPPTYTVVTHKPSDTLDNLNFNQCGDLELVPDMPRCRYRSDTDTCHGNKTNSNNVCLMEQTDPSLSECRAQSDTTNANTRTPQVHGIAPVIDELWFDCLETENTAENATVGDIPLDRQILQDFEVLLGSHQTGQSKSISTVCPSVSPNIDFLLPVSLDTSCLQKYDLASATPVGLQTRQESQTSNRVSLYAENEFGTGGSLKLTRQTASETKFSIDVEDSHLFECYDFESWPDMVNSAEQNINSNADSLLRHKKSNQQIQSTSQLSVQQEPTTVTESHLDVLQKFAGAQGCITFDLDLAHEMGMSNEEIKELLLTAFTGREERAVKLEQLSSSLFDVDIARDMGLTRKQVKVLVECSKMRDQAQSLGVDVDLARQMGLSPAETERLSSSSSPLNNAKFMMMMGEAPFDPGLALSMGLTPEQVTRLSDSSLLVSRAAIGNTEVERSGKHTPTEIPLDLDRAKAAGLTDSQIKKLSPSSSMPNRTGLVTFNRQVAKAIGLRDDQINILTGQQQNRRPVFLDTSMAQKMALNEAQVKQLAQNSTNRMLGEEMFDPYLAMQMGMTMQQIKKLASTMTKKRSKVNINEKLAKTMGLNETQISVLKESIPLVKQADFDPTAFTDHKVFDIATASSLGLHTREINQLLASSSMGSQVQLPPRQPLSLRQSVESQPECDSEPEPAQRRNFMRKPTGFVFQFPAVGDGASRKASYTKKLLMSRLQASVSDGDRVSNVLNTLVEWNSILLVVIFLLLLGTSCPTGARKLLPCPIPSACETLNTYIVSPLGLDRVWHEFAIGWNQTLGEEPPKGAVYTVVRTTRTAVDKARHSIFHNILVPLATLPGTAGVPLLKLLYSALCCTAHTAIYYVFYACGSFLGFPVPATLQALQQESGARSAMVPGQPATGDEGKDGMPWAPHTGEAQDGQLQPFNPAKAEPLAPDLHTLHQYGGFLFYVGFDPPKKGCNYSTMSSFLLWLIWSLPEECA